MFDFRVMLKLAYMSPTIFILAGKVNRKYFNRGEFYLEYFWAGW